MQAERAAIAIAAIAFFSAPAATAQTVTMEAESMTLSNYSIENGNRIRVTTPPADGTATDTFTGASGSYKIQVHVIAEADGPSTLDLYRGSTLLKRYTYPLADAPADFTIDSVALNSGDTISFVGTPNLGAVARVDKIVFTSTAASSSAATFTASNAVLRVKDAIGRVGRANATPVAGTTQPPLTQPPVTQPPDTQLPVTLPPVTQPPSTNPPPLTLPSTNTKAIATFESLGLYWTPPSNPGAAGCNVQYRKSGESAWKNGLAMWYDARNSECRGSIVYLTPGTEYQVQFSLPGQQPAAQLAARTWSESFQIARTVTVSSSSQTLSITEGGSAGGYVLYTAAAGGSTIDVANAKANNVTISAPYVIVRGLTLKGAQKDAVRLLQGAHDVVIEDNDISGWGSYSGKTTSDGQQVGTNYEAAVRAQRLTGLERVIVQRNKIHHPRYGASSWTFGHPEGPQGIGFEESAGGNHVFRHNEIYSSEGHYFNDGMGEGYNFSTVGFPHADSDIYGNLISHCWDDAIESEGGNRNVRIWGNYMDRTMIGVATTATQTGPVYIFRNVHNRSRKLSTVSTDLDSGMTFGKSGTSGGFGDGRRYVFHNTILQATASGMTYTLGAGGGLTGPGVPMTNTVSRNNIWHIKKAHWAAIDAVGGSGNDLDFDMFNGNILAYAGAEPNGLVGTPIYESGHGWTSEWTGLYQLSPTSPGYDRGVRLPNFNDHYTGSAPDMGAAEAGRPAMRFGLGAAVPSSTTSDAAATK